MTTYCDQCSGLVPVVGLVTILPYPRKQKPVTAYEVSGTLGCAHGQRTFITSPGQVNSFVGGSA